MLILQTLRSLTLVQRILASAIVVVCLGIPFTQVIVPAIERSIVARTFDAFASEHLGASRQKLLDDIAANGWLSQAAIYTERGWLDYHPEAERRPLAQRPKHVALRIYAHSGGTFVCALYETGIVLFDARTDRMQAIVERRSVSMCL